MREQIFRQFQAQKSTFTGGKLRFQRAENAAVASRQCRAQPARAGIRRIRAALPKPARKRYGFGACSEKDAAQRAAELCGVALNNVHRKKIAATDNCA